MHEALESYKAAVDGLGSLNPSDRKKLLSLPFYMSKRAEKPTPREGQDEMALYEELSGEKWYNDVDKLIDSEDKITEFNFEQFFDASLMEKVDYNSASFKELVKSLNFFSRTKMQVSEDNRKKFQDLMPHLAHLTADEKRDLVHMMQNKSASARLLDAVTDDSALQELAELSEVEKMNEKNNYRHKRRTMDYADPKKMPIDERKVADVLRNQHIVRNKANSEIGTYQANEDNIQFDNAVASYINEAANGDMRALLNDIGMSRDNIQFMNLAKMRKLKEQQTHTTDDNFKYLMNALFTPVNMMDHEDVFVGWDEVPGILPFSERARFTEIFDDELYKQTNAQSAIIPIEGTTYYGTSPTW